MSYLPDPEGIHSGPPSSFAPCQGLQELCFSKLITFSLEPPATDPRPCHGSRQEQEREAAMDRFKRSIVLQEQPS